MLLSWDQYATRWSGLHGGVDPRRGSVLFRGWLRLAYGVGRMLAGTHWYFGGRVPLERVLFGSHAPYFPIESALLRIFESRLTLPQMQAIMETNARRVLQRA